MKTDLILKIILNVLTIVGCVTGFFNLAGTTHGVAEGFGLALFCLVSNAALVRLDRIHAAIGRGSLTLSPAATATTGGELLSEPLKSH